jgi:ABC-type oligopeptide transport system ATPase subunit
MIKISGLKKHYTSKNPVVKAVDGVDLTVNNGEIFGLTGESGCGKTTLAKLIIGLLPPDEGRILLNGHDISKASGSELKKIRPQIQIIWQNPQESLNPRMKIGDSILEPLRYYKKIKNRDTEDVLKKYRDIVGLRPDVPERYPHEVSGGENQRAVIARILTLNPELIIADEPTAALDVSVQAQIISLLKEIQKIYKTTIIFISHDIEVIRNFCGRVAVMRSGRIVEQGPVDGLFSAPKDEYTKKLIEYETFKWRTA